MFRRRRKAEPADAEKAQDGRAGDDIYDDVDEEVDEVEEVAGGTDDVAEDDAPGGRAPRRLRAARTDGPFDVADVADVGDASDDEHVHRIDFGAVRVPVTEDTEIRVEVDERTGAVRSIAVVHEQGSMQLGAFAAPRSEGIWEEVRRTMMSSLTRSGGTVSEQEGPFGTELRAQVPVEDGKRRGTQRVRFVGVDGPRWFLRGALTGPAADDDEAAEPLLSVFRTCVVVRGGEPRAPHEPLPLAMPEGAERVEDEPVARPADNPFRRGPEITETR